jgi:hypothetical protein
MDIEKQHSDMVKNLVNPGASILAHLTPFSVHLIHAALGIAGEVGEILDATDDANALEESGDLLFYCRELRERCALPAYTRTFDVETGLPTYAGEVVDVVKRLTMYNMRMTDAFGMRLLSALDGIESWVEHMLHKMGKTREDSLRHNIHKLLTGPNARFATGSYSDAQAHGRADKVAERMEALRRVWCAVGLAHLFECLNNAHGLVGILADDIEVFNAAVATLQDVPETEVRAHASVRALLLTYRQALELDGATINTAYPQ